MSWLHPFWQGRKTERKMRENESDRLIDVKNNVTFTHWRTWGPAHFNLFNCFGIISNHRDKHRVLQVKRVQSETIFTIQKVVTFPYFPKTLQLKGFIAPFILFFLNMAQVSSNISYGLNTWVVVLVGGRQSSSAITFTLVLTNFAASLTSFVAASFSKSAVSLCWNGPGGGDGLLCVSKTAKPPAVETL